MKIYQSIYQIVALVMLNQKICISFMCDLPLKSYGRDKVKGAKVLDFSGFYYHNFLKEGHTWKIYIFSDSA